jgi:secreted trypsin-like serine protease
VPYNDLHYVNVTTISNEECRITYGTQITDEMVCTAGNFNEGTCIGDSGGPLLQDTPMRHFMLVGVASFVSGNGCESLDPSGFSRAFSYMPWLNQVLFGS